MPLPMLFRPRSTPAIALPPATGRPGRTPARRAIRELALVAALFLAYKVGRLAADGHIATAFHNAEHVGNLERSLHWPDESLVQDLLLRSEFLTVAANAFYAWVHFPATALFLIWMYCSRPAHYLWIRRVMVLLTGSALLIHLLVPLAPPRMLASTGMVDTGRLLGPSVYGAPDTDTTVNQFAAMPSLHVGWAVVVAVGMITVTRSRLRWLWLAHPALTFVAVVGTANHYWLDGVVACLLLAAAFLVVRSLATHTAAETWHGRLLAWTGAARHPHWSTLLRLRARIRYGLWHATMMVPGPAARPRAGGPRRLSLLRASPRPCSRQGAAPRGPGAS